MLWKVLHSICNMQYALNMQYAGSRHKAIGPERIKPILNHPLPMILRQLRGFLGIIGYCRLWVSDYGELARPLYEIITEKQQAQTNKLV